MCFQCQHHKRGDGRWGKGRPACHLGIYGRGRLHWRSLGSGTIGLALFKHEGEEDWEQLKQILDMTAEEWNAELKELNQEDEEDENKEEDEQEDAGPGEG